ncbi:MAG: cellulose binding domain-containing protein [Pseudochelatococcus sp.]|uniref:cellulose binding domain-containing protein n=1 Tax=Pseudochelatococcus sp. TaxID=2020869 RepID=UPI003D8D6755
MFDEAWGFIYREEIAPVYLGEFGTKLVDPKDAPWFDAITAYLAGDFDNDGVSDIPAGDKGMSWTYWSWNPNSGDTGGILKDDWTSVHEDKLANLTPIQFDFDTDAAGGGSDGEVGTFAEFLVTLSEPADDVVTVDYHTVAGTASHADFTPTSGTLTFQPGEQSKTIAVAIRPDLAAEADEQFTVVLSGPDGAVIGAGTGTATIVNDDGGTVDPQPEPSDNGLEAAFSLVDSWNSGFNASIVVRNEGAAVNGWRVELELDNEIANIWNAEIISRTGNGYVIGNAAWNGNVASGGEVTFGFIGVGQVDGNAVDIIV